MERFLNRLEQEGIYNLLEIGAGTGRDSKIFSDHGYNVICIDLSQEMVQLCKEKGLHASVMDFYELDFQDASFNAVYALNCLLHVPKKEIDKVLIEIKRVLKPQGIFYLGLYGGKDSEGIWEKDWCEPKQLIKPYFELVEFNIIAMEEGNPHFQSILLRKHLLYNL